MFAEERGFATIHPKTKSSSIMSEKQTLRPVTVERLAHGFRRTLYAFSPSFVKTSSGDKFGYLFNPRLGARSRIPYTETNKKLLEDLGKNMLEAATVADPTAFGKIDAGYTYFGQFIDHDLTLDVDSKLDFAQDARKLTNYRTPNFDLDSLYGDGPAVDAFLYDPQTLKFLLGQNLDADPAIGASNFDLPRSSAGIAIIGDPRNDENLFVAQFHVGMLKFHNAVMDALQAENPTRSHQEIFEMAQVEVRRHYQWCVIHDFLRTMVGKPLLNDVLTKGPKIFSPQRYKHFFMPVEFSVGAYRFGHSMVRDRYRFNQVFDNSEFFWAFAFTRTVVPDNWVINWPSLFSVDGGQPASKARKIDTRVALGMGQLPGAPFGSLFATLSSRNLVRSMALQVVTGQAAAKAMGETPLTEEQLKKSPYANPTPEQMAHHIQTLQLLQQHDGLLLKQTPLWYYILKEAEVRHGGNQLGPVGGRIVAEVFYRLLQQSPSSFLKDPAWKPRFGLQGNDPAQYKIVDILRFAGMLNIPGIS